MDQAGLPERLEGDAGRADRGDPRDRPRRRRHARRRHHDERPARPGPDQPVPHPDGHPERRRRPGRDPVRDDRAELHDGVGLRDGRPRHRRGERDDPPRRRRRDGRRRRRGRASTRRSSAGSPRCARSRRATTTRPAASRPFDTGPRRLRHRRGRRRRRPRGARARARRAAPTILAELVGYGATADASHITLPAPGGIGAVRAARRALEKAGLDARRHRPRQRPRDLDARGRQGRAPGDPDDLRRPASGGSRSRPTSRCSATPSAPPARSRRSSRS